MSGMRRHIDLVEDAEALIPDLAAAVAAYVEDKYNYGAGDYLARPRTNAAVDAVFDREMPMLPESYRVFRGITFRDWNRLTPETDFRHRSAISLGGGYVSTTLKKQLAVTFLSSFRDRVHVLFAIRTLAGARGAVVADHYRGRYAVEQEIILHKEALFRVVDKRPRPFTDEVNPHYTGERGEYWEVDLEQMR